MEYTLGTNECIECSKQSEGRIQGSNRVVKIKLKITSFVQVYEIGGHVTTRDESAVNTWTEFDLGQILQLGFPVATEFIEPSMHTVRAGVTGVPHTEHECIECSKHSNCTNAVYAL